MRLSRNYRQSAQSDIQNALSALFSEMKAKMGSQQNYWLRSAGRFRARFGKSGKKQNKKSMGGAKKQRRTTTAKRQLRPTAIAAV